MTADDKNLAYIEMLEADVDRAQEQIGLLRMEAEHEEIERDHEEALLLDQIDALTLFTDRLLCVSYRLLAHYDLHKMNYMSEELGRIVKTIKEAVMR